ncbi:hypothetical protein BU23DRAFT_643587 [Bimuria novae-zelandiae CBS 107.79]|uniref:Uncharacterized protein n=1 Tax=Bimuria novae-zelandiae CBS 107.79 TaxID=1447943 RepID=A0A6A5V6Y7_9PLEO|nr:hypothetical protein BU23DRAFT_643587 [Bimuria novae-zelandiae CBS 107.79]
MAHNKVLMVGSVPGTGPQEVFSRLLAALPGRLQAISDGETGERNNYIGWQLQRFPRVARRNELGGTPLPDLGPPTFSLEDIEPTACAKSRAADFAASLADYIVDYRTDEDALVSSIEDILKKEGLPLKLPKVFDAISQNGSLEATLRVIDPNGGAVSTLLPPKLFAKDKEGYRYPEGVTGINTAAPKLFDEHKEWGYVWSRYMTLLLREKRLAGHPFEMVPGGLNGVLTGLRKLHDGKASGMKYVYRIEETGSVGVVKLEGSGGAVEAVSEAVAKFPFSVAKRDSGGRFAG